MRIEPQRYVEALRDWVGEGAASRFALEPDEVVARSAPRPPEASRAAACFELGQYLHRIGEAADAISWFRDAHRLAPGNWTYKRQAWEFLDPVLQGLDECIEWQALTDLRQRMAEAARSHGLRHLTRERMVEQMEATFAHVLKTEGGAR